MPANGQTADTAGRPPYGTMRKLSTQERREWQQATLATPPPPLGAGRAAAVLAGGPGLRPGTDTPEVPGPRIDRPVPLLGVGAGRLLPRQPEQRPQCPGPPPLRQPHGDPHRAGQRGVAPAHPRGAHRGPRHPGEPGAVPAHGPADRARRLPAVLDPEAVQPGLELPAQRRHRRPPPSTSTRPWSPSIPNGRTTRSRPTWPPGTLRTNRWPTCSARLARMKGCTRS